MKEDERQFLIYLAHQMATGNFGVWWRDYPMNTKRREYIAEKWYKNGIAGDHCRLTPKGVRRAIEECTDADRKATIQAAYDHADTRYESMVWPGENEWRAAETAKDAALSRIRRERVLNGTATIDEAFSYHMEQEIENLFLHGDPNANGG